MYILIKYRQPLKKEHKMFKHEDLEQYKNINIDIVKEAVNQAEKRLIDIIDAKKVVEKKLLHVSIILFVFGSVGLWCTISLLPQTILAYTIGLLCVLYLYGSSIWVGIKAFAISNSAYIGSNPFYWFTEDTIETDKNGYATMLGYLAIDYQCRIDSTLKAQQLKVKYLKSSIGIFTLSPVLLLLKLLIRWVRRLF